MPALPTSTSIALTSSPEVHTRWHITFEVALAIACIIVFIFALLVLYVVTHMKEEVISNLKATIRGQKKELKGLRKLRRKNEEVRRMLLPKVDIGEQMG
ncbi:hypothetical protein N431DRAFT_471009 [Stipitochalara longipes BDJ]|nr:hypothetical protein N431DRAFT_471009 [Stipitochalara longipes BDJ]